MKEKKGKIAIPTEEEVSEYASESSSEANDETQSKEETVESLRAQLDEHKDKLLRAQAECANISKRLQQQHSESLKLAQMALLRTFLPVVDSFERTLQSLQEATADGPVLQGVRLIADQLRDVLRSHGVEPIEAVGKPFDPMYHEAMMQDRDSDSPPGTVTSEMERGYKMQDRVLRPSKVAVAAKDEEEADETESEAQGQG
jgi:molecular chaperone GrpE